MFSEAITPEQLVRKAYQQTYCLNEDSIFRIYGDEILIGESFSPRGAWNDAAQNLPAEFLEGFSLEFVNDEIFYEEEKNDQEATLGHYQNPQTFGSSPHQTPSYPS